MTLGPPRDELEELFDELGELHELRAAVQKKVLAHDIKQGMKANKPSISPTPGPRGVAGQLASGTSSAAGEIGGKSHCSAMRS